MRSTVCAPRTDITCEALIRERYFAPMPNRGQEIGSDILNCAIWNGGLRRFQPAGERKERTFADKLGEHVNQLIAPFERGVPTPDWAPTATVCRRSSVADHRARRNPTVASAAPQMGRSA
jgi:hypothetical protein